ncbi:universal stress protein family protein [Neolewinella xylanilytica]|uniref:Universal stress protein family protein n=1 Tax=Neolewinella xylanilytica TaxID=1514080 RepID=A0A2S6I809_9BACT|nr:universal stress protein [Neolewinella xylanilytica]PPK87609.1 universal stress protein family protein [Neolewinella xylanilytica]
MQEVIVPVDFSPASATALRFAARLVEESGMQLRVIYPYTSLVCRASYERSPDYYLRRLEVALTAWVSQQLGPPYDAGRVDVRVIDSDPAAYLLASSQEATVALIVMGLPEHHEGGGRLPTQALSEAITAGGGCPVILIPAGYEELAATQLAAPLCGRQSKTYRRRSRLPAGLS